MKSSLNNYTKRDTDIIKGFAILCIVFHNYFHWLAPSPGENEFNFSLTHVKNMFHLLGQQPGEFVNILFSYFGHYGVQLFIMISGFGLVLSMMNRPRTWGSFMLSRLKKLYPLLLTAIVFFFFGRLLMEGRGFDALERTEIGYKLLFIHTLLPNSGLSVCGPWWFFGLIFQLYLVFPLLFRCLKKWGWGAFGVVCVISYGLIFLFREYLNLHQGVIIMQNAPAHLPEFCFGMMLAFNRDKRLHWLWLVLALAVFIGGNFTSILYPFTFLSLCVIAVFAYHGLKSIRVPKQWLGRPLAYFGGLSMMLFVVHGFLRTPILKYANTMPGAWGHLGSGILFFLLAWGVALAAKPLYLWLEGLCGKWKTENGKQKNPFSIFFQGLLLLFFLYVGAYYVRQNMARHPSVPLVNQLQVGNGNISTGDLYVSLARFPLEKNHLVMHVEGSFDVKKEAGSQLFLVAEIQEKLWKVLDLRQTQEGEWTHCEFSYDYLRPFISRISGKDLKIYFWNRDQKEAVFKDFTISVNY